MIDFNAKKITRAAIFVALSFVISFIEFPLFPQASFLKLDFSNVFILIGGFSLGPIYGVIILLCKELLCLFKTTTYVGQIANFLMGLSYILVPTVAYKYKKGIKLVVITLVISTLIQTGVSLLVNRFINFPLFLKGMPLQAIIETFNSMFWVIVLFNLIKGIVIGILTILLYKRTKKILKI